MKRSFFACPLLSMAAAFVTLAIAWPAGAQSQQPIYGSQLMTQQERPSGLDSEQFADQMHFACGVVARLTPRSLFGLDDEGQAFHGSDADLAPDSQTITLLAVSFSGPELAIKSHLPAN